jgi:tyrosyl-tRNA synthetase
MGGGTTKVGDPSFRSDERPLLSPDQIDRNIESMRRVFAKYLSYGDGPADAIMLNNAAWLDGLNYLEFLRDVGRFFSVNRMPSFESVRSRLDRDQSLSFLEFNYMILQAYDFMELNRRHGCRLQMGGSDQWGNITKMGKTAEGAVWLNEDMLSPYEFWQFWRNTMDADVGRFLRLYTELPLDEIARLEGLAGSEINAAKIVLANEATAMAHGRAAAQAAEATARATFEAGGAGDALPTVTLSGGDFGEGGISIAQLFVRSGLAGSGKEARRLIADGGARLDDEPVTEAGLMLTPDRFARPVKLSAGRKRHALAKLG